MRGSTAAFALLGHDALASAPAAEDLCGVPAGEPGVPLLAAIPAHVGAARRLPALAGRRRHPRPISAHIIIAYTAGRHTDGTSIPAPIAAAH